MPGIRKHIIHKPVKRKVNLKNDPTKVVDPSMGGESVVTQIPRKDSVPIPDPIIQMHEVFVELDELVIGKDNQPMWKEKGTHLYFQKVFGFYSEALRNFFHMLLILASDLDNLKVRMCFQLEYLL